MTIRPLIVFLDHDYQSVGTILERIGSRITKESKRLDAFFRLESVVVPVPVILPADEREAPRVEVYRIVDDAVAQIVPKKPDAVLVDLSYDSHDDNPAAVPRGIAVAAELKRRLTRVRVGVYSRHGLRDDEDVMLSLEQFAIVLVQVDYRLGGRGDQGATWWFDILNRLVGDSRETTSVQHPPQSLFITHAHEDSVLAEQLKSLLCAALRLDSDEICATSVVPALPPGESIPNALAAGVSNSKVLLVVLTARSAALPYVWFEVGVAHAPGLRAPSVYTTFTASGTALVSQTPVGSELAIDLTQRQAVDQLLSTIADTLRRNRLDPQYYANELDRLLETAAAL